METEIVIVGAGLAGAATAYHLRQMGLADVVIVDKEAEPGTHSSGRNAAMLRERQHDADLQILASEGAEALRRGDLCEFRRTGGMLVGDGDEEASLHFPLAQGRGRWCPNDGVVDPAGLLETYLRGQTVLCNTEVLDWKPAAGGVVVRTGSGTISARYIVNAAGAWAGVVGKIPLTPTNRHLFQTPPMPQIDRGWPYLWDVVNGLYFRPESGGLLMCPCDEEPRSPGDYRIDYDMETRLGKLLARLQPRLHHVAIKTRWTGQRTFSSDRKFVIGFDPRFPMLLHVAGLGGHGLTASYAVGRMAAALLTGGGHPLAAALDPARLLASTGPSEPA